MNLPYFMGVHGIFLHAEEGCDILHLLYFLGGHGIFSQAKERM
jgi:hypothetical protein